MIVLSGVLPRIVEFQEPDLLTIVLFKLDFLNICKTLKQLAPKLHLYPAVLWPTHFHLPFPQAPLAYWLFPESVATASFPVLFLKSEIFPLSFQVSSHSQISSCNSSIKQGQTVLFEALTEHPVWLVALFSVFLRHMEKYLNHREITY